MLGVSPWVWAWMGALAPGLWFGRTVIWAFLVDRITRAVVEKADVKDLPEVLTGLGVLAGALSAPGRPAPYTAISAEAVADGAPAWPVMIQDGRGGPVNGAVFMVSYANREEKGSDANVAAHLLLDVLGGAVDGALVMSNDSDLRFPIQQARQRVPVAIINPSPSQLAGALRGGPAAGAGRHWWARLSAADLKTHQLPDPAGRYHRPPDW